MSWREVASLVAHLDLALSLTTAIRLIYPRWPRTKTTDEEDSEDWQDNEVLFFVNAIHMLFFYDPTFGGLIPIVYIIFAILMLGGFIPYVLFIRVYAAFMLMDATGLNSTMSVMEVEEIYEYWRKVQMYWLIVKILVKGTFAEILLCLLYLHIVGHFMGELTSDTSMPTR